MSIELDELLQIAGMGGADHERLRDKVLAQAISRRVREEIEAEREVEAFMRSFSK